MPAYKVLIVDDDFRLRLALRLCLQRLAYTVWEAATGAQALALAEHHQPDLILLDLGLPDGDGLVVAQELRRRPSTTRIPIAVFTGQPLLGRRAKILASICAGTIPKPVTLELLERDLRLLITMRRGRARRFPRFPVEATVWWRLRDSKDPAEKDGAGGLVRTLSEGGLMLELRMPIAVASLLDLRMEIPAGEVTAGGQVVWSRFQTKGRSQGGSYQHGVQFMDVNPETLLAIQRLLEGGEPATR